MYTLKVLLGNTAHIVRILREELKHVRFYILSFFFLLFIYLCLHIHSYCIDLFDQYYTRKIKRWRHKSNWQSWFWCKCQHAFPGVWMWKGHSRDFMRLNVDQRNPTWISHWTLGLRFGRQPLLSCKQIPSLTFDIRHRRQNETFFNHFFLYSDSNFFTFQSYYYYYHK